MKRVKYLCALLVMLLFINGCTTKETNVEGTLESLMEKVYAGVSTEELPSMIENYSLTEENQTAYIGEADIDYVEAIASESAIGSVAHSIVLIRMADDTTASEIEAAKEELEQNINPRKWLCVGVEEVHVENNGNLIIAILNDQHAAKFEENFENLK